MAALTARYSNVPSASKLNWAFGNDMTSSYCGPGWPSTTVAFASDLAIHTTWGTCYQLGPGSIHVAHRPDEQISKAELREGVALYVKLARELLSS